MLVREVVTYTWPILPSKDPGGTLLLWNINGRVYGGHYLEKTLAAVALCTFIFLGALYLPLDLGYLLEDTHRRETSTAGQALSLLA